ncbi:Thioredoxin-like protein AAED1 [Leucoagaricus sp. SymC.cos]|nr:Thioredoxin-like protein AAED1 [Leucoagaricus sp. SymC.cos]
MSTSVHSILLDTGSSRASVSVKRKPPPPAGLTRRPSTSPPPSPTTQTHHSLQQVNLPFRKLSFSERYPEPDPTDPFAPLWVLRNRTCSALHREGPPVLGHLLQQKDTGEFGIRQPDRRRSISYLQTLTAASTLSISEASQPAYASDHGHGAAPVRAQRAHSIDNGSSKAASNFGSNGNGKLNLTSTLRRQSMRPTPLSQVTALTPTPSISRSPVNPIAPISSCVAPSPTNVGDDSSGTESDVTRVGHVGPLDVEATPRAAAQPSYQDSLNHHQPPHQEPQRARAGSASKLTRFLKARRASRSDSNSHNPRASITGINRIRKASISPPVFSTVVWAGQGGEFVPIKNHPLQQNAISILAATPPIPDALTLSPTQDADAKPDFLSAVAPAPVRQTPSPRPILTSASTDLLLQNDTVVPLSPPVPPALAARPSTSAGHTDESQSTFSYVHVPTALSSPSLAQLAASQATPGPGASASITSSATMRIKRTSSRPMSKLPPLGQSLSPSPLINSTTSTNLLSGASELLDSSHLEIGEWDIPSLHSLTKAASLPIIAESGVRITFGTLFAQQKVAVLFIRHFWCPLCQDYMTSVASLTRRLGPEAITGTSNEYGDGAESNEKSGDGDEAGKTGPVKLVVISNGSYTLIGKYKQIFGSGAAPLDVYTDPSLAVYTALGLGKDPMSIPDHHSHVHGRSNSSGIGPQARLDAEILNNSGDSACSDGGMKRARERSKSGGYVKHGLMSGIAMVFVRALKVGMPVWEKGGDLNQLGGEFVLGPGLVCTYAHRMQTTKDHAPFDDVLRAAGIVIPASPSRPLSRAKEEKQVEKQDEKKPSSLRKSRPSIGNTFVHVTSTTKVRARGQTIDIVPPPTQTHLAPAMPTSASSPLASKLSLVSDVNPVTVPERKKLHRRRRSVARSSIASVTITPKFASSTGQSLVPFVRSKSPAKLPERRDERESEMTHAPRPVSTIPIPSHSPDGAEQPPTPVMTRPRRLTLSADPMNDPETKWKEDRHRSLQKIKEKKNARRGLSQFDERQATTSSMAIPRATPPKLMPMSASSRSASRSNRSQSHSRSRSPSDSLSPSSTLSPSISIAISQASQSRHYHREKGMERTRSSRHRHGSTTSGMANAGVISTSDTERAVQSDTGLVISMQRERSAGARKEEDIGAAADDDNIVLIGREMKMNRVNLSGDHLARQGFRNAEVEVTGVVAATGVEDDVETVSERTLAHQ